MERQQKEIKPILEDSEKYGIHIKIRSDNKETKWFIINRENLISLYNSFN